jgi:hypothetical protein
MKFLCFLFLGPISTCLDSDSIRSGSETLELGLGSVPTRIFDVYQTGPTYSDSFITFTKYLTLLNMRCNTVP